MTREEIEAIEAMKLIKMRASVFAKASQDAKDGDSYRVDEDLFVVYIMTFLGYVREDRSVSDILSAGKEVWHRADD